MHVLLFTVKLWHTLFSPFTVNFGPSHYSNCNTDWRAHQMLFKISVYDKS